MRQAYRFVDEVLYHARIHPEHRCNVLSEDQISSLYKNVKYVCQTAVDVNADASKFPDNWLFRHRWVRCVHITGYGRLCSSPLAGKGEEGEEY
jgi:ribosomal protein S13